MRRARACLEEYPTRVNGNPAGTAPVSMSEWLDLALEAGGAGAMLWNLSPQIDEFTFTFEERESRLQELRRWVDGHAQDIFH